MTIAVSATTLSLPTNTTCDIYRAGNAPPAAPDVAAVRGVLQGDYERRLEAGEGEIAALRYTHVLLVNANTDIRDGFSLFTATGTEDSVYVPDKTGTRFRVVFVERQGRGQPTNCNKVYLDRYQPTWPTNNL